MLLPGKTLLTLSTKHWLAMAFARHHELLLAICRRGQRGLDDQLGSPQGEGARHFWNQPS